MAARKGDDLHGARLAQRALGQHGRGDLDGGSVTVEATGVTKPHDVIKVKKDCRSAAKEPTA